MDSFHSPLSLFGIGQLSPPILHLTVLQEAVVLLPSRTDLLSATDLSSKPVLLLPKLRSELAEFLCLHSPLALVPSAPTHLCRLYVRFLRLILSCATLCSPFHNSFCLSLSLTLLRSLLIVPSDRNLRSPHLARLSAFH